MLKKTPIPPSYFAEGLHPLPSHDLILLLTWKERTCLVFNHTTLEPLPNEGFQYKTHTGEGWGITGDGKGRLYVSDGSEFIFVWDEESKEEIRRIKVHTSQGKKIRFLNELEWYNGSILANIWYSDTLVRIDPETGRVAVIYDFKELYPKKDRPNGADCFNGIAKIENDELLVTGKLWDKVRTAGAKRKLEL